MIMDRLMQAVAQKRNPSILGLDTRLEYLPQDMRSRWDAGRPFESAAELIVQYNRGMIDALGDLVSGIKLQIAFYEMYGVPGLQAVYQTLDYARQKGLITILDAKRNDIGSTAEAYASACIGRTPLPDGSSKAVLDADILTVNAYLGIDGIRPFIDACKAYDKGIFILVKTSNPSSGDLQDLHSGERSIYQAMAALVQTWGKELIGQSGYSALGAVVGATYPKQGAQLRKEHPAMPFLLPGYGAQGAGGQDLAQCFDANGLGCVVNASRSLLCAHQKPQAAGMDYQQAARQEALHMREDLLSALQNAGRLAY